MPSIHDYRSLRSCPPPRRRTRRIWAAALTTLLLSTSGATAYAAPLSGDLGSSAATGIPLGSTDDSESYVAIDPTSGTLIADSGFDVRRDGFSFANWPTPDEVHRRGLTPETMHSLYGDRICARFVDGGCVLTATGQALQDDLNETWNMGHCFGFAAVAGLFATGGLDRSEHLATGPDVYDEPPTDHLDGLITRYASTQVSPPTSDVTVELAVADVLARLESAWARGDNYILAIQGDIGGHAVNPIALRDLGDGRTGIVLYDNNFPGVEKMLVANAAADTWYYTTALNPADTSYLFVGSPENRMTLTDLPQTATIHECPICRDSGDDSVLVLIKDNAEDRDGTIIDWDLDITAPGGGDIAGLEPLELMNNQKAGLFRIPAGTPFEITMDDVPAGPSADVDISLYGDGWINELDDIILPPGSTTSVTVDQDQRKLNLTGTHPVTPTLRLATEQASWSVGARGTGMQVPPQTTLSVERATDGDYVYTLGGAPASLDLVVRHRDAVADRFVTTDGPVSIPIDSSASVGAHAWDGAAPLTVRVEGPGVNQIYPMIPVG